MTDEEKKTLLDLIIKKKGPNPIGIGDTVTITVQPDDKKEEEKKDEEADDKPADCS